MYTLYMHITPSNKRYIGITSNIKRRWHGNGIGYHNQLFWRAIQKYGWDNIRHEIILDGLSYEWACQLEQMYISMYDSMNPLYGYNRTFGGAGSKGNKFHHSVSTRKQMSNSHKGKVFSSTHRYNLHLAKLKQSDETRKKISESHKRENLSIETRQKLSEAARRPCYEETKEKLRQINLGKHLSEETKQKISRALKGKKHKKSKDDLREILRT